jgi:pantoate--beta-alanine ligase
MILFKRSQDLRHWLAEQKIKRYKAAFVPTMGALHAGHISLIKASMAFADRCICSIFVNPAQFNNRRDFEKYPVSLEKDIEMLAEAGADTVFIPTVKEIYPLGDNGLETYDLGTLETTLEGRYRPGHFQGVCQVISRLLNIVEPDFLFMGQKDYQQCLVVERLIRLLEIPVEFHAVPTIRETDGLAQSSRNRRLTDEQRKIAPKIYKALKNIRETIVPGDTLPIIEMTREKLDTAYFRTDYVSIARQEDLQQVENWDGKTKILALIAAFLGEVRLIDNLLLN